MNKIPTINELKSISDILLYWEKVKGDEIFLRQPYGDEWREITWKEAGGEARKMTAVLQQMGMKKGDHVGIISKNCYHWILADMAIIYGGFVSVPFFPNLNANELEKVLHKGDVKLLFVGKLDEWDEKHKGIPEDMPVIQFPHYPGNAEIHSAIDWNEAIEKITSPAAVENTGMDDLWTVIFTSGTTGTPKGVMLNYSNPIILLGNEQKHNELKIFELEEFRFFSYLPLNHIAERIIVELAAMATGGTISFAESIESFPKNLKSTKPTVFLAVPRIWTKFYLAIQEKIPPTLLNIMLHLPILSTRIKKKIQTGLGLHETKILLTGAAPISAKVKSWFGRLGMNINEVYGMTETTGGCALLHSSVRKKNAVGKAMTTVKIKIAEDTREVLLKMPWNMKGYYNEEEKTKEILKDEWLYSGDQGYVDEEGFLYLTGRVKDTFKTTKGEYIVPNELEEPFASSELIEQICVVGFGASQPLAMVVLSDIANKMGKSKVTDQLTQLVNKTNPELNSYQRISAVVIAKEDWTVENGVLTPTLKIKRRIVDEKFSAFYEKWCNQKELIIWE